MGTTEVHNELQMELPDKGVDVSIILGHAGFDVCQDGKIRIVGDAMERFAQDPALILRACRYCSQFGLGIETETMQAMMRNKMRLLNVDAEIVTYELQELLLGDHAREALLECVDVIAAIMPEVGACKGFDQHTPYHIYDVLEHTAWVVERVPATPLARWSALFHDIGKPGAFFMDGDRGHFFGHPRLSEILARDIMERLCLEPKLKADILTLVRLHDRTIQPDASSVKDVIDAMDGDVELFRSLCQLKRADALAHSPLGQARLQLANELEQMLDRA